MVMYEWVDPWINKYPKRLLTNGYNPMEFILVTNALITNYIFLV